LTPDIVPIAADTGIQSHTDNESFDLLSPYLGSQSSNEESESHPRETTPHSDWLDPIPSPNRVLSTRHTDVSRDLRYETGTLSAVDGDTQCPASPRRIPDWVVSRKEIQELYFAGHGTAPDLIYAKGVPDSPHPDHASFDKKAYTLVIIEIGFCRDLGCDTKLDAKTNKYFHLNAALKRHRGRVEFVAFPIRHAGTTLTATLTYLTAAFSTVRPRVGLTRASRGILIPNMDHTAKAHDYILFKSLLDSITDLAQFRLLGIINNRKRLVESLPGKVSRTRAHSEAALAHTAVTKQDPTTNTHMTRTSRASESIAIT